MEVDDWYSDLERELGREQSTANGKNGEKRKIEMVKLIVKDVGTSKASHLPE